jgi:hypothetical protein
VKQLRNATFPDAKAIDRIIAEMPPLLRDLHSWVNQANFHVALLDGDEVIGFGARMKHTAHPQRDLAAVYASKREDVDALFDAMRGRKPLKIRLPADDDDGIAMVRARGFTERIRSATFRVDAATFPEVLTPYQLDPVEDATRELHDAVAVLYADTHRWDPPAPYTRRYVRQAMLAGAQRMAFLRDGTGEPIGVGVIHASEDESVAADVSLVGPLDQSHPDADLITRALLGYLAAAYRLERAPLWFEIDRGYGTNHALANIVTPLAPAEDEVVILTTD